ncbi:hypothetical protein GTR04_3754 [Trichophyton interdigitale]|nr:hypothetical protein GTR04_3754 [Trichophyton interdigitale]
MCTDYFQAYRDCKKAWVSSITSHAVCFMAIFYLISACCFPLPYIHDFAQARNDRFTDKLRLFILLTSNS